MLGTPHFIAHQNHGNTERQHRDSQKVFYLAVSQFFHRRIIRRSLYAAVPAQIVIRTAMVAFPVSFIVFAVIGDKVVERKTIVTGHKVDTLFHLAVFMTIYFGTTHEPVGKACY